MEKRLKFPETITKDNKEYTFVKQCNNSICLYHRFINGNEIRECFTIQELGIVADCKGKIKNDDIEDGAFADLQKKHGNPVIVNKYTKNMKLLKTYPSIASVVRKEKDTSIAGINRAIKKGGLYKGFYWRGVRNGEIG